MMDYKKWSYIIMILIFFIVLILRFIIKFTKNNKLKNNLQTILSVISEIIPLIKEAETFINYSGEEKKKYVESRVLNYVNTNGLKIDENIISESIDDLVDFTKHVNFDTSKKTCDKSLKKLKEE